MLNQFIPFLTDQSCRRSWTPYSWPRLPPGRCCTCWECDWSEILGLEDSELGWSECTSNSPYLSPCASRATISASNWLIGGDWTVCFCCNCIQQHYKEWYHATNCWYAAEALFSFIFYCFSCKTAPCTFRYLLSSLKRRLCAQVCYSPHHLASITTRFSTPTMHDCIYQRKRISWTNR